MKQFTMSDGSIVFSVPDSASDVEPLQLEQPRSRRRGAAGSDAGASPELARVLEALTADEPLDVEQRRALVTGFTVDVGKGATQPRRRGAASAKSESLDIDVTLKPGEGAVVLIEKDGAYEWQFPQKVAHRQQRRRPGGPAYVEAKIASFRIPIGEGTAPRTRRGGTRMFGGVVSSFIKDKVVGFVLKFVARKAVGALSRRLEKGVSPGPVVIESESDISAWRHCKDYSSVKLPAQRPGRVLLLIHGTFSSTVGSFGALTEQSAGKDFLARALQDYDAVLAYDHYTLADTPEQNAEEIFDQLDALQKQSKGLEIDAIAFSRGGLVLRWLTEQVVPHERSRLTFRKVIFVGCTNAGTELADQQNWKTLVDFYTTLVAGASRLLGLVPGSRVSTMALEQGVRIIGSLVKYIAQEGIAGNAVPGLASMQPEGDFVTAINTLPMDRNRPGARFYYAIGSDFEPGDDDAGGLGKCMALKLADGVIDRLMGTQNDLVVHTDSMFVIDPVPAARLVGKMPFSHASRIYHTIYFQQPQVAKQCAEWLELVPPARAAIVRRSPPRDWWAAEVSNDFVTLPASMPMAEAADMLASDNSRFVVLERNLGTQRLHYAVDRGDLEGAIESGTGQNPSAGLFPLEDWLGMSESDANDVTVDVALATPDMEEFRRRTASLPSHMPGGLTHAVIIDEMGPIGVAAPLAEATASMPKNVGSRGTRTHGGKAPETVWCHAHASMPEEAVLKRKASVEVVVSRDQIMQAVVGITAGGGGKVRTDRDLIIQVQARKHCVISGESRAEIPVPPPGEEAYLYFDIVPRHAGLGEVRVIVRQGNSPIVNLKLLPRFVTSAGAASSRMAEARADLTPADHRCEIKNVLYIRDGQMGEARTLEFEFEYEVDGEKSRARGVSQPFANEHVRLRYITSLYQDIEKFWAESDAEYEAFMFKLRARGAEIFKQLIPRDVQQVLWDHRNELKAIQVFSDEPFIPWELAYLVEPGKKISNASSFLAERGLVRGYTDPNGITRMPPTRLRLRADGVRYVIPEYPSGSDMELPGAQDEKAMLNKLFDAKEIKPDKADVINAINTPGNFDFLHFACHGVANSEAIWDAGLYLQGKMSAGGYREDILMSSEVDGYAVLNDEQSPGPVVFLNACQVGRAGRSLTANGGFAKTFMSSGAGVFVGTHWSIGDLSAVDFAYTFYDKLKNGKNIMDAVAAARNAAKNKEEVTWLAYVVYADPYARIHSED